MKSSLGYAAALFAAFAALGQAANDIPKCGDGSQCPDYAPCCSQYGQCGVGAYCLGGCDPRHSFDLQSCLAAPVCKSNDFSMDSLDAPAVRANTRYLGNGSETNWVTQGQPVMYDDSVLLTMAPSTVGTLLMSAHYVWYGKISATMKTSQGAGVITAFILMSDMKDEIDFEFVGTAMNTAETNYYYQGITNYDNGEKQNDLSDTRQNWHTYEIDWKPESIDWSIDGKVVRTLERDSTYNDTTKQYNYPQTPSRVQLSLWPGGLESNGQGTIEWAGGLVDWDSKYMTNGYYHAAVKDIKVECYDPPKGDDSGNNKAYYYTSTAGTESDVAIGTNNTIIGSFQATGDDPNKGAPSPVSDSKSSSTSSSKKSTSTATVVPESVPGMTGGGAAGNSGGSDSGSSSGGSSGGAQTNSNGDTSGSAYDGDAVNGNGPTSFDQGMEEDNGGSGGTSQANHVVAGSAVALLGFFIAALML